MPLDSDVSNADSQLTVSIYLNTKVGPDLGRTFIRIAVPGNQLTVVDRPIRDDDKTRFSSVWRAFEAKLGTGAQGVPLETWAMERPGEVTEGHLEILRTQKFQTVEQLALASDGQLQGLGMGGIGLRTKAGAYLQTRAMSAPAPDVTDLKAKNADLERRLEAMQAQIEGHLAKKKPGRPPKSALSPQE
jgi:hypothetical protein